MAHIEAPFYYHGFKFGAPVFTHRQPWVAPERPSVGIAGLNRPATTAPSEIILQIMEILSQQPDAAGPAPLRLLPVANPVALEFGDDAPSDGEWPVLAHLLEEFQATSTIGFLGIGPSGSDAFQLSGTATIDVIRKLVAGEGNLRILQRLDLTPLPAGGTWSLRLEIPQHLSVAGILKAADLVLSLLHYK
ncbi:hypothetical protein OVA24_10205 [Luteolibacter sp. SL250]|uniref:hypothetical protein n=1 Tax=Luteolibacter sp. SL250 TaxID=2995170 RepID=UPI0022709EDA|nr:hypothetical protein [Luteolibacter sp. SL250]WAC21757.1 hypothetical protein OVA24_10205 [Luteolibacter sp. SL250]